MKELMLLFSFWPLFAFGQIYIDFESGLTGQWDQYPLCRWESSDAGALSGIKSLHHIFDNPGAGTDIISLNTGIFNQDSLMNWDFLIRHAYLPSSSNKWLIMILSDNPAGFMTDKGVFSGYGLGVNLTSSDDTLRFYAFQDGIPISEFSLGMDYEKEAGTGIYHFNISCDKMHTWTVKGSTYGRDLHTLSQFICFNNLVFNARYFGVRYTYTSTCDRLVWLDDLKIHATIITDTLPPEITEVKALSSKIIHIVFSEYIDTSSLIAHDLVLTPGNLYPDSIYISGRELQIFFKDDFISAQQYYLNINRIIDLEGNIATKLRAEFTWYEPEIYDLIITEIMADPQPPVYLMDKEYVEIFNRSKYTIDLDSLVLKTGSKIWKFPSYSLNSGEYVVITSQEGTESFSGFNILSLFTSSMVITNEGQEISILDRKGRVISALEFNKSWYGDNFKSEGGWSLERIDTNNVCGESDNWTASVDLSGGTPGRINSVSDINPDKNAPKAERVIFHSGNKIELCFSESLNPYSLIKPEIFMIEETRFLPESVIPAKPLYKSVLISYPQNFSEGLIYTLKLSENIKDCSENKLKNSDMIRFGIPTISHFLDVLISEVLYSPVEGCPEFIELYNASGRLLELSDLRILVSGNKTETQKIISSLPILFFPDEYIVLTRERNSLNNYFDIKYPERIIECKDLPLLSNDGGCIKILNRSLQSIDEYCYSPEDQFALVSDQNGVSLERLRFDHVTGNQSVWHSSSSLSGFGTPGYENSQKVNDELKISDFQIKPEIFSPDNDGIDDLMILSYVFDKEGYSGSACIFDPAGRLIKYLARNEILGTHGFIQWDGRDEFGRICHLGMYVVYMEAFHPGGKKKRFKGTVVLGKHVY